jgi:hypothetical protein
MRKHLVFLTVLFSLGCGSYDTNPVADPGPDQTVLTGSIVQLDGSHSERNDCRSSLFYAWHIYLKPEGSLAVLSNREEKMPTFVADVDGLYVISLGVYCSVNALEWLGSSTAFVNVMAEPAL